MHKEAVHVLIKGRVQGVGFRYFAQDSALELGLFGWVRNLADGDVEAVAEGRSEDIETWIRRLHQGPSLSRIQAIQTTPQKSQGSFNTFSII